MKWSFKLASVRGIEVRMHLTFFVLLGFVALSHWQRGHEPRQIAEALGFVLALFACVVLHEFGHALTAAHYGCKTRDITLLPIGGVARLERMPEKPRQELWVAFAGPAVNVAIACALFAWLAASRQLAPIESLSVAGGSFLERLMVVNIFLALFNLLPAFPMDGGRVLRAALSTRMGHRRATQIAASIGQALAVGLAVLGFFYNPVLMFIALFVWMGASQESRLTQLKSALDGIAVSQVMMTDFRSLAPDASLADAAELMLSGFQTEIPIVEQGRVLGLLSQKDLLAALSRHAQTLPVGAAMVRASEVAEPGEMLDNAFGRLVRGGARTLPVLHRGQLVGLLSLDNIGEFVAIRSALLRQRPVPSELPPGAIVHGA